MKLTALMSGGKDSVFAVSKLMDQHTFCSFVCLVPENKDSYMFHSINTDIVQYIAQASNIPLCSYPTKGIKEEELDELKCALELQIEKYFVEGVCCGAVESSYQKTRIEKICKELGVACLSPLWQYDPEKLLFEMIRQGMDIRIAAVAADGLDATWLGRKIDVETLAELKRLNERKHVHIAGEGGEYETVVLDAPFFKKRLVITDAEKSWKGNRGFYRILKTSLCNK